MLVGRSTHEIGLLSEMVRQGIQVLVRHRAHFVERHLANRVTTELGHQVVANFLEELLDFRRRFELRGEFLLVDGPVVILDPAHLHQARPVVVIFQQALPGAHLGALAGGEMGVEADAVLGGQALDDALGVVNQLAIGILNPRHALARRALDHLRPGYVDEFIGQPRHAQPHDELAHVGAGIGKVPGLGQAKHFHHGR
jgi:hypothetical protein